MAKYFVVELYEYPYIQKPAKTVQNILKIRKNEMNSPFLSISESTILSQDCQALSQEW